MAGWKIPEDWDGTGWACYQIQWPASLEWQRLLRAMLFTLTRGRDWDGATGTITDAQSVGWSIYDKNHIPVLCEVQSDADADTIQMLFAGGASITIERTDEMGQVVTEVKMVGNELRVYYGKCCWDVVAVFDGASILTDDDSDITVTIPPGTDPAEPDPLGYTECGKAQTLIDRIFDIGHAAWDNRLFPATIKAAIETANPGYSVSMEKVTALYIRIAGLMLIEGVTDADIFNGEFEKAWKCNTKSLLNSPDDTFQATEFFAFGAFPLSYAIFSESVDVGTALDVYVSGFWQDVVNILGRERCNQVMEEAIGVTGDCSDCGTPAAPDPVYDWDFTYDFTASNAPFGSPAPGEGAWSAGIGYYDDGDDYIRVDSSSKSDVVGVLRYVKIEYTIDGTIDDTEVNSMFRSEGSLGNIEVISYAEMRAGVASGMVEKSGELLPYSLAGGNSIRWQIQARENLAGGEQIIITKLRMAGTGQAPIVAPA